MRATIDIPDRLRAALLAIAAGKGYRGYSKVVVEALDYYLAERAAKEGGVDRVLSMRGSWSKDEGRRVRGRISLVRRRWRQP